MRANKSFLLHRRQSSGVALVIVLAFIVLLTGLVVAFFSRAMNERAVSNSSASLTKATQLAEGAADQLISNLQQEIVFNSTVTGTFVTSTGTTYWYTPLNAASMLPQGSGTTAVSGITSWSPNLLKRSGGGTLNQYFCLSTTGSSILSGAVAVSSTTPSLNGRSISLARWNKHCLLTGTDSLMTPIASQSNAFAAPDWVLVSRNGTNPVSTPIANLTWSGTSPTTVVGRYAYAIYHEGGLLDVNVAGYPQAPATTGTQSGSKSALAYADLASIFTSIGMTSGSASSLVDQLVLWRNNASTAVSGSSFNINSGSNYYRFVLSNTTGFLSVSSTALNNAGVLGNSGQSDRLFVTRQELIRLFQTKLGLSGTSLNALNYLTHFSRDLNQPTYISPVQTNPSAPVVLDATYGGNSAAQAPYTAGVTDKKINPNFPLVRVQQSFTRNDGTTANIGEPLMNKRFALNRLAWVTYAGPICTGTGFNPAVSGTVINSLRAQGLTDSFLLQGSGTNIQKYFGLNWDSANKKWTYDVHNGGNTGTSGGKGAIMRVGRPPGTPSSPSTYVQDANREPDFFELLKAGISLGSLGKASTNSSTAVPAVNTPPGYSPSQVPANMRYPIDSSVDYHVMQIGANILSEVNPTSLPVRIAFDDGTGGRPNWEFQGVTDLPYLSYVFNGVLRQQPPNPAPTGGGGKAADGSPFQYPVAVNAPLTSPGNAYMIQVPAVWNPYDPNGTPSVLRPSQFRIVIESNDPLSPIGSGDQKIWHGAMASTITVGKGGSNVGLNPPNAVYSWTVNGAGKSPEYPTQPPTYPAPGSGSPIFDAVKFDDGNGALYREPTIIFKAKNAGNGNATRVNALTGATPGNAIPTPGDINSFDPNPLVGENDGSKGPWAPLVLGQFPLAFASGTNTYYTGGGLLGLANGTGDNRVYFTYRLQYLDPNSPNNANNWITYDTKYGRTTHGLFAFQSRFDTGGPNFFPSVIRGPDGGFSVYSWASAMDPRTARFGLITDVLNKQRCIAWGALAPADQGWIFNSSGAASTATDGITYPIRQDNTRGFYFANCDSGYLPPPQGPNNQTVGFPSTRDVPYPSFGAGWTVAVTTPSANVYMFAPGMYAQNNTSVPFYDGGITQPSYYADADGVVRRAAGAYVPVGNGVSASTPVGLPPASINGYTGAIQTTAKTTPWDPSKTPTFTQSQSRPLLLHRPFRSVAELGYVFRDLPWKNLDFFTPESGDAGLLDLFCINETSTPNGLIAGKVNLNTRQSTVISAIVSGACVDDPKITNTTVGSVSPNLSGTIGNFLIARTTDTTNYGPLQNLSELVGKWVTSGPITTPPGGYKPTNTANQWGIDLPSPLYKDGKSSYTGFSSNIAVSGAVPISGKDLYSVFTSTPPTPWSLMESMSYVQRFREAPIRALASVGQTRVWNLLIDIVAQTGRYPQSASGLDKFLVEGEQHYWVHVAIDRMTGQVLDKQVEIVKE